MLLIQIPTLDNIDELLNKIQEISNELINIDYEFLIVDHSKINYSEQINLFKNEKKLKKINYYHLKKKSKKNERGLASRFGYIKALDLHEYVDLIELDSDNAHSAKEILKIYNHAKENKCEIVIASKYLKGSKVLNRKYSRVLISAIYNFLNKKIFGLKISDTTNGYRYYSKSALSNYTNLKLEFITPIGHLLMLVVNHSKNLKFGEIESFYSENINYKSSINIKQLFYCLIDYFFLIYNFKIKKFK